MLNPDAERYFLGRSAHSDLAVEFLASLKRLGEYEIRGDLHSHGAPYAVTAQIVFCGATGMNDTYWRLRPADHAIALRTGAEPTVLGSGWVRVALFRTDWPRADIAHWALRAYDFARTGK